MLRAIARSKLREMSARYDYDTSYMEWLLDASPGAFFKFAKLMDAARHREAAPANAYFAAKLVGALAEDCGPCTQLVVNMSREAGVPADQIEAVLRRDLAAVHEDTALGFRFADAIAARSADEDAVREEVRTMWGDKGVVDLTFALQIGRMFPMIKAGLGYAKECRRVRVGDKPVDVIKRAA
jgi:hypothetical protein